MEAILEFSPSADFGLSITGKRQTDSQKHPSRTRIKYYVDQRWGNLIKFTTGKKQTIIFQWLAFNQLINYAKYL